MSDDKKAVYILMSVGLTLPGYKRKDLKVGKAVTLDEKIGDAYAKKGLLKKGEAVEKTPLDKELGYATLKVKELTQDNELLGAKLSVSEKANQPLKDQLSILQDENLNLKGENEALVKGGESLKKENESLKKEVESSKKENESLKKAKK